MAFFSKISPKGKRKIFNHQEDCGKNICWLARYLLLLRNHLSRNNQCLFHHKFHLFFQFEQTTALCLWGKLSEEIIPWMMNHRGCFWYQAVPVMYIWSTSLRSVEKLRHHKIKLVLTSFYLPALLKRSSSVWFHFARYLKFVV